MHEGARALRQSVAESPRIVRHARLSQDERVRPPRERFVVTLRPELGGHVRDTRETEFGYRTALVDLGVPVRDTIDEDASLPIGADARA